MEEGGVGIQKSLSEIQGLLNTASYHQLLKVLLECRRYLGAQKVGVSLDYKTSIRPILDVAKVLDDIAKDNEFVSFLYYSILIPIKNRLAPELAHEIDSYISEHLPFGEHGKSDRRGLSDYETEGFEGYINIYLSMPPCAAVGGEFGKGLQAYKKISNFIKEYISLQQGISRRYEVAALAHLVLHYWRVLKNTSYQDFKQQDIKPLFRLGEKILKESNEAGLTDLIKKELKRLILLLFILVQDHPERKTLDLSKWPVEGFASCVCSKETSDEPRKVEDRGEGPAATTGGIKSLDEEVDAEASGSEAGRLETKRKASRDRGGNGDSDVPLLLPRSATPFFWEIIPANSEFELLADYKTELNASRRIFQNHSISIVEQQKSHSQSIIFLLQKILKAIVGSLGKPPCELTVCILGSSSRLDRRPCSDLELMILHGEPPAGLASNKIISWKVQVTVYIYHVFGLLELMVYRLGETPKKIVSIKKDPKIEGFRIDAGTSFLNHKNWGTPTEMAKEFIIALVSNPTALGNDRHAWLNPEFFAMMSPLKIYPDEPRKVEVRSEEPPPVAAAIIGAVKSFDEGVDAEVLDSEAGRPKTKGKAARDRGGNRASNIPLPLPRAATPAKDSETLLEKYQEMVDDYLKVKITDEPSNNKNNINNDNNQVEEGPNRLNKLCNELRLNKDFFIGLTRRQGISISVVWDTLKKTNIKIDSLKLNDEVNIKDVYYKPIAYLALVLKLYYKREERHPYDIFEALKGKCSVGGKIMISLLQSSLNFIAQQQIKLHGVGYQEEVMKYKMGKDDIPAEEKLFWAGIDLITRGIIIPLKKAVAAWTQEPAGEFSSVLERASEYARNREFLYEWYKICEKKGLDTEEIIMLPDVAGFRVQERWLAEKLDEGIEALRKAEEKMDTKAQGSLPIVKITRATARGKEVFELDPRVVEIIINMATGHINQHEDIEISPQAYAHRAVNFIRGREVPLHFKEHPDRPLMPVFSHLLHMRIFGSGSTPAESVLFEVTLKNKIKIIYPVLISLTVLGETLEARLDCLPEFNLPCLAANLVMDALKHNGDGFPRNFVVSDDPKNSKCICVDCEQIFVNSENEPGLMTKQKIQEVSIYYCLPAFQKDGELADNLPIQTLDVLANLNVELLLNGCLTSLEEREKLDKQVYGEHLETFVYRSSRHPFVGDILFEEGTIGKLALELRMLRALAKQGKLSAFDVLTICAGRTCANEYFKETNLSPNERLKSVAGRIISQSSDQFEKKCLSASASFRELRLRQYSIAGARKEIDCYQLANFSETEDFKWGEFLPYAKELTVVLNFSGKKEVDEYQLTRLIKNNISFMHLIIKNCSVLDDVKLCLLLKNSRETLKLLNVNEHLKITKRSLDYLKDFPKLEMMLVNQTGVMDISATFQRQMVFNNLRVLQLNSCKKLKFVKIVASQLLYFDCKNNQNLNKMIVRASRLITLNLEDNNELAEAELSISYGCRIKTTRVFKGCSFSIEYGAETGYLYTTPRKVDLVVSDKDELVNSEKRDRAHSKQASGCYEEAISDYDEAIKFNPNDALAFRNRGNSKRALGQYNEALSDFNEAINLAPKDSSAFSARAKIYRKRRETEKFIHDLQHSLSIRGTGSEYASYWLGKVYELKLFNLPGEKSNENYYRDAHIRYKSRIQKNLRDEAAIYRLGVMYQFGRGVEKDIAKALKCYLWLYANRKNTEFGKKASRKLKTLGNDVSISLHDSVEIETLSFLLSDASVIQAEIEKMDAEIKQKEMREEKNISIQALNVSGTQKAEIKKEKSVRQDERPAKVLFNSAISHHLDSVKQDQATTMEILEQTKDPFSETLNTEVQGLGMARQILDFIGIFVGDAKQLGEVMVTRDEVEHAICDNDHYYTADFMNILLHYRLSQSSLSIRAYPAVSVEIIESSFQQKLISQNEEYAFISFSVAYGEDQAKHKNHWVAIIVDKKHQVIFYLDPACKTRVPKKIEDLRILLKYEKPIVMNSTDFQAKEKKEGWVRHCGVYVIEIFDVFEKYIQKGQTIAESTVPDVGIGAHSISVETALSSIPSGEAESCVGLRKAHRVKCAQILIGHKQSYKEIKPKDKNNSNDNKNAEIDEFNEPSKLPKNLSLQSCNKTGASTLSAERGIFSFPSRSEGKDGDRFFGGPYTSELRNSAGNSFLETQSFNFLDSKPDPSNNNAGKKFMGELDGRSELNFEQWLSRDSVAILLPLIGQKGNANVKTFCALDGGIGIAAYSSQMRKAVQEARKLGKSLFVISKEPVNFASQHYVLTIFHRERIYFIDPTGQVRNGFCSEFIALTSFYETKIIPLLTSKSKLQNDPDGLVSCGVICLALCEFFAEEENLKKLEEIEDRLETKKFLNEGNAHFMYNEFALSKIFPSLVPPATENYRSSIIAYRAKFYALLNELDEHQIETLREADRGLLEIIQQADMSRDELSKQFGY